MLRSWKLGKVFGIGIYVHATFFLLLAVIFAGKWQEGLLQAVRTELIVLGVFTCVLLHELGHALTARRFGIPTRDITLYPIGGVARLERMSEQPVEEFCIAIAGPAVNVIIVGTILVALSWAHVPITGELIASATREVALFGQAAAIPMGDYPFWLRFVVVLGIINFGLVIFNLLPIFPMDGGRVLRALLSAGMGHLQGTEWAATIGLVLAGLLSLAAIYARNPIMFLVGLFVIFAGRQELAAVRHRAAMAHWAAWGRPLGQYPYPRRVEPIEVGTVDQPLQPPEPGFSGFCWDHRTQRWVEWREGRVV